MFLPSECLDGLKCTICNRLLSVFPIYVTKNEDNQLLSVCGRCQIPDDDKAYLRNEIYETITKAISFPCINREYGCMEDLLPENVHQHELICRYRLESCGICKWNGQFYKFLDHYKCEHAELILQNYKFTVNINEDFKISNLLLYKDVVFLFERNFDHTLKQMKCSMSLSFSTEQQNKYYAQINLITDDATMSKRFPEIDPNQNKSNSIDINIENILNQNNKVITGIVKISTIEKRYTVDYDTRPNDEASSQLKCSSCTSKDGNNLLVSKAQVTPNSEIHSSIDHVMNIISESCRYGCGFISFASDLQQHHNHCSEKTYNCLFQCYGQGPPKKCEYQNRRKHLANHISRNHARDTIELENSTSLSVNIGANAKKQYCKYLIYPTSSFILIVEHVSPHLLLWRVEILKPIKTDNNFTFEIIMASGSRKLSVKEFCAPFKYIKEYNIDDTPCIWLHLNQIKNFICDNCLPFTIAVYLPA